MKGLIMNIYEASIQYSLIKLGESQAINSPELAYNYMKSAYEAYPTQESFWVLSLDNGLRPIGRTMISLGILNATTIHPREVYKAAILTHAASIMVSHNHPSGDPAPSSADIKMTRTLKEAGDILSIPLTEHIICGEPHIDPSGKGFYSFHDSGFL